MTNPILLQQKQKDEQILAHLRQQRVDAIAKCYASKEALTGFIKEKEVLLQELKGLLPTLNRQELDNAYLYSKTLLEDDTRASQQYKVEALYHINALLHKANHRAFSQENQQKLSSAIRAYLSLTITATVLVPPTIIAFVAVLATVVIMGALLSKYKQSLEKSLPEKVRKKTIDMNDKFTFFVGQKASKHTSPNTPPAPFDFDELTGQDNNPRFIQTPSAPPAHLENQEQGLTPFYQP